MGNPFLVQTNFESGLCTGRFSHQTDVIETILAEHNPMNLFEDNRNYVLGDDELSLLGDRDKLAQWRHKGMGPAFYKLGRKIVYRGLDLNTWANAQRVEPH